MSNVGAQAGTNDVARARSAPFNVSKSDPMVPQPYKHSSHHRLPPGKLNEAHSDASASNNASLAVHESSHYFRKPQSSQPRPAGDGRKPTPALPQSADFGAAAQPTAGTAPLLARISHVRTVAVESWPPSKLFTEGIVACRSGLQP